MRNKWKSVLPVFLLIGLQACTSSDRNGRDHETTKMTDALLDSTQKAQALTADVGLNGDEKVFTISAATGGRMEVELANLAIKKTKEKSVKEFAQMMLKDHNMINQELSAIANQKGLKLPEALPEKVAADLVMLNTLADRAFDVQYMRMMINDHEQTIQLFTDGSHIADNQLRGFALKTLPTIQKHHQLAVEVGKRLNIDNRNNGDDVLGNSPAKVEKK
ncbi:DUF4142 domain-containing protein [Pedobacter gandavensis]|uniref:DUF4142 domain-containing protein n=1 Tax=Pedobacter gandavensis TaxID=2679963 RepID=UPI00247B1E98|nr:DUF4142 domain-containing protein [Pedobacter gandavensis]WGQ10667.1 DUF4142 domain-containing protein [Pedobacter gandavensis]